MKLDPIAGDIVEALAASDPRTRAAAIEALGLLSRERAQHLFAGALHDPDSRVRRAATRLAGELGATSAVFSLILGLDDADATLRSASSEAIEAITGRAVGLGPWEAVARERWLADLQAWWKQARFDHLAGTQSPSVDLTGSL